jgi:hypothetical protein
MGFVFSLLMGLVEKFFASQLEEYLQAYHAKRIAQNVANAPLTKSELAASFK